MKVHGLQSFSDKAKKAKQLGVGVIFGSFTNPVAEHIASQGINVVAHTPEVVKEGGHLTIFVR